MSLVSPIIQDIANLFQSGILGKVLPAGLFSFADVPKLRGGYVTVASNTTITTANAADYNGKVITFSAAATLTLSPDLGVFSCRCKTPPTGNASIARSGAPVTINGGTSTVTRALAQQRIFDVFTAAADAFEVTGS